MAPPPNGGYPNPNTNSMFVNRNPRPATGFSASRLPRKDQQPGERPAQGQGQQRAYSPIGSGGGGGTGGGQSPQQGGPPVGFPQQPPPRQGSSGSPVPYQHPPPPNANNGARRASGPIVGGGGGAPPPSRLANAPHNSLPTPSPFAGGLPPAPSAALKEKLSTLPVLLYKLHKSQEAIQADAEYFDLPLLPSDEADELAKRVKDARGKARAAREREWDAQRENLVDVVVEALSEFAGRKIEELVARGELREVGSADASATNRLRNELQSALADKADLVAKLSRLEVDTSDRLAKMQEELDERIEEVEERWKVEVEKLRKAGPPAVAGLGTMENGDTVSKAEHAALAANFDALTAKFDRLAALVGEATPSPPTTASSGSPPAASSTSAPAAATVLGKRPFSTSADEPSTTSASPPSTSASSSSSAASPTLFARLSNVDARVTKVEASVAEHAAKDLQNLEGMKRCAREVQAMKDSQSQAGSSPSQGSVEEGKMVVDISEEGKEEREKQSRKLKDVAEHLETLEKVVGEQFDEVDSDISTLRKNVATLQQHPLLAAPPPASNATPPTLRTDLDSLTARLDTISASLSRLPTSAHLSLLSTLHNHIQSLSSSSSFDTTEHILAHALSERLKAWDKAVRDLAAQEDRLAELEPHEGRIAKLERGVKAHKTKTDQRFRSIKDLIEYLETALPEFERVATGYAKLQESGLIPPDETLGIAAPQPPHEEQQEPGTPPQAPQTPAQAQGQQNGCEAAVQRAPVAAAAHGTQLPLQQQQQRPAQQQVLPPAAAAPPPARATPQPQIEANGFADGSDEEDELDEDSMLVAPEGEVEEDDPMTGGAGGGGTAGVNGFVAR